MERRRREMETERNKLEYYRNFLNNPGKEVREASRGIASGFKEVFDAAIILNYEPR